MIPSVSSVRACVRDWLHLGVVLDCILWLVMYVAISLFPGKHFHTLSTPYTSFWSLSWQTYTQVNINNAPSGLRLRQASKALMKVNYDGIMLTLN